MYKYTRGAGGGRVPKKLPAAALYWSGTQKAARNLTRYDPRDDEEPPKKVSAPSTVPLSDVVRRNREIEQQLPSDVGKVLIRKGDKVSKRERAAGARKRLASTLYVGNLGWTVKSHDLIEMFSEVGKVLSSQLIYDRKTNRPRGFGFVEMDSYAGAEAAIVKLNGRNLKGRTIRVMHDRSGKARSWISPVKAMVCEP